MRRATATSIVLVFEDLDDGSAVSLGVAFSAAASRSDESCEARFIAKGALTKDDLLAPVGDDEVETLQWHAVRTALRARDIEVDDAFSSATDFVAEALRALSPAGFPLDPRRFQKAFRNALLLKPVDNPTDFVRNYVLDVQTIQVDRLGRSIEHWRFLTSRIEELKDQSTSLTGIRGANLTCLDSGAALAAFDRKLGEIQKNIEDARRNRDPKLLADLERLKAAVSTAAGIKSSTQRALTEAQGARDRAEGAYESYMLKNRDVLSSTRRYRARQVREGFPQSTAMHDYQSEIGGIVTDTIPNLIAGYTADRDRRSTDRRSSLAREMTNALNKHNQDFHVSPSFTAEEATPAAVEQWATSEKQRLDAHELVQYEEQCRNAASEMTSAFRDDLLHRLDDASERVNDSETVAFCI
jgi:hypothetical protein